jgi:hypothetical protein
MRRKRKFSRSSVFYSGKSTNSVLEKRTRIPESVFWKAPALLIKTFAFRAKIGYVFKAESKEERRN